ncbi:hypothetical protein CCZ01_07785 [Helicobacter monodelphidis]|uniref:Spy/CpxP family protein refolding chaperone n=1 Tax=Helicobacter sp. 15-1451 TaxID=2004995 RepID=UPI000DCE3676|nr:Spy/CpxP family protein refolding chaperone [Helicobacter sp. 15-1451]RAX56944.1 hypothetical protein CCZ01_07785 [Helicobacter sp. 15-1451]
MRSFFILLCCSVSLLFAGTIKPETESIEYDSQAYIYDWKQDLKLTQKQFKKLRDILRDYRLQNSSIQDDYARNSALNHNLFIENQYDATYYIESSMQIERKRLEAEKNFFTKIHHLLTPEQRKAFAKNIDDWSIQR